MAAYCAAKFGVIGLTEALGLEVRSHNIRVSVLLPGSVATDFSRVAKRGGRLGGRRVGDRLRPPPRGSSVGHPGQLEQPAQAWTSEVVLRPLNLELRRTRS